MAGDGKHADRDGEATAVHDESSESNSDFVEGIADSGDHGLVEAKEVPHRVLLLVLAFLDQFSVAAVLPLFGPLLKELGAKEWQQGLLASTYGFLQMLSSPFIGRLSDHYGRRFIMILSFCGAAAGYTLLGASQSIHGYFLSRVIVGTCKHSGNAMKAFVADNTGVSVRAVEIGQLMTAMGAGGMLGPVVGGILHHLGGYSLPILLTVICQTMLTAITMLRFSDDQGEWGRQQQQQLLQQRLKQGQGHTGKGLEEGEEEQEQGTRARANGGGGGMGVFLPQLTVLKRPSVLCLFAMRLVWGIGANTFDQGVTLMLLYKFHQGVQLNSLVIAYEGMLRVITRGLAIKPLISICKEGPLLFLGLLVLAVSHLVAALSVSVAMLFGVLAPVYLSMGVIVVVFISVLTSVVAPTEVGQVLGYYDTAMAICKVVGPATAGFLASSLGPSAPGLFSAGVVVLSAVIFFSSSSIISSHHPLGSFAARVAKSSPWSSAWERRGSYYEKVPLEDREELKPLAKSSTN